MFDSIVITPEGRTFLDTILELGKKKVYVGFPAGGAGGGGNPAHDPDGGGGSPAELLRRLQSGKG